MQPNPDPKPGRWILPVVILAMMGFAYLFINAAEDPTVSASDTTRSGGSSGTTTTTAAPPDTTTTTALPAEAVQYNEAITAKGLELADLLQQINDANADWDARTVGYAETLSSLQALEAEVKTWRTGVDPIVVPASLPEYANFHSILTNAATQVSRTAGDIVIGLQAPDTGEARTAAVAAFNEAVTAFGTQVNTIAAYRPST
ncbi:MAG: hypothetical protein HKN80_12465 [Acidimicrobiia bacterium]|nr:hypothetical protein [Acidimicrobiia bacterium]